MLMSTVVAVALGFAPVNPDGTVQPRPDNYARVAGHYTESVDSRGNRHLRGFNGVTGQPYDVVIDANGNVEAAVGDWTVTFQVRQA